ncbi:MAG: prepilin-type N-terminal cleavage/methylation domain-containing protein [Collimonas sp.]|uniref:pilus assembly FimT family protein n=1 Tax=Collimonas sp. TaxID=1963772 RepID=UPI0032644275
MLDHQERDGVLKLSLARGRHGFTLIELAITLTVMTTLLLMGVPSFVGWLSNSKVRSVAEGLQNGLRAAQAEAVRRSHQAAFVLTSAAPIKANATASAIGSNWYIQLLPAYTGESLDANGFVQGAALGNLAPGVSITGTSVVCFNSMGRVVANNNASTSASFGAVCAAPAANMTYISYDVTRTGATHPLRVMVGLGGQVRMCDTTRSLTDAPDGCP